MVDISKLLNTTLAGQLAQKLDAADGKKDGKISASIWNDFVKDKGGKTIQSFISVENAMNSITTYSVREAAKNTESNDADALAKGWLTEMEKPQNLSATDENPPATDAEMAQKLKDEKPDLAKVDKTIVNPDGTKTKYDQNGYIKMEYDKDGKETRSIIRKADGMVDYYADYEYDKDGKETRSIIRKADGMVDYYADYEYDKDGKETRYIFRKADGMVDYYIDFEYDKDGKETRSIFRKADGMVDYYIDFEYDKDGKVARCITRKADGTVGVG